MEEKDFVAMAVCPECGESMGIAIDNRLKKTLDKYVCTGPELCEKCVKEAKEKDWFIMYEIEGTVQTKKPKFTGRRMKLRFSVLNNNAPGYNFIKEHRFCLATEDEFQRILGLGSENHANNDNDEGPSVA